MGGRPGWSKRRQLVVIGCLLVALAAPTAWLWNHGTRGAELANVLQFPISSLALALAVLTWFADRSTERGEPPERTPRRSRRLLPVKAAVAAFLALVLTVLSAWFGPALVNRARIWGSGCEHPTQLRLLAAPDQVQPVRQLTDQYEGWTRQRNYGCPTVRGYVYGGSAKAVRDAIVSGWSGTSLRDIGPRPDAWFAGSAAEVERVRSAIESGAVDVPIPPDDTIARSPVVFAVAAPVAHALAGKRTGLSWTDLLNEADTRGWDVVRPDPVTSFTGELSTAVLYGGAPAMATTVERRIGRSLDEGGYPLAGDLDILCRYRQLNQPDTALVVSEQAVVRYNRGDPLGAGCGGRTADSPKNVLLAFYPSDTRALEHRFVRLGRAGSPQDRHAEAFGRWLAGDEGRRALEEIGLRPPGSAVEGPLTWPNGVLPEAGFRPDQLAATDLDNALQLYSSAQRPGRVLLALDASGSMGSGAGSRFEVAAQGVISALDRMGRRDEFGLWIFPKDPSGTGAREIVPIGPRNDPGGVDRPQATRAALAQVRPAGNTPLFQTIADGVTAVGPSDDSRISGLVVLTDGEDTTSELTPEQLLDVVKREGVRVFVIAVGDATCATIELEAVAAVSGGKCEDADLASIETKLTGLFSKLWSG